MANFRNNRLNGAQDDGDDVQFQQLSRKAEEVVTEAHSINVAQRPLRMFFGTLPFRGRAQNIAYSVRINDLL